VKVVEVGVPFDLAVMIAVVVVVGEVVAVAAVAVITPASGFQVLPSLALATAPPGFGQASCQTIVKFDNLRQLLAPIRGLQCDLA